MIPKRDWMDMTWEDFADARRWVAVLPVAAVEQHGPHLPLGTDAYIGGAYLERARRVLPDDLPVTFLPMQVIGASAEHSAFPGTLSLGMGTLMHVLFETGASVHRAGVRKLVIVNSHGGNAAALDGVALDLRVQLSMLAVVTSWSRLGYPAGLFSEHERRFGIHGGEIETSVALAHRPDAVRMAAAGRFSSAAEDIAQEFRWLNAGRPAGFGWMTQDLNPAGALGDAAQASGEKGEAALDHGARAFIELLQEVDRFDLSRLIQSPRHDV